MSKPTVTLFTPAPDIVCRHQGIVAASVWGVVWRIAQQTEGICYAPAQYIARLAHISEKTVRRLLRDLVGDGYVGGAAGRYDPSPISLVPASSELAFQISLDTSERLGLCSSCNEPGMQMDHIHPRALGGSDDPENLQLMCSSCNRKKGTKTMAEWES